MIATPPTTPEAMAAERERYRAIADAAMAHVLAGPPLPNRKQSPALDAEPLRTGIERLIAWCDERRDAADATTLGMVQQRLRALLDE